MHNCVYVFFASFLDQLLDSNSGHICAFHIIHMFPTVFMTFYIWKCGLTSFLKCYISILSWSVIGNKLKKAHFRIIFYHFCMKILLRHWKNVIKADLGYAIWTVQHKNTGWNIQQLIFINNYLILRPLIVAPGASAPGATPSVRPCVFEWSD